MATSLTPKGYISCQHTHGEFMSWEGAAGHIASILEKTTLYDWAKSQEDHVTLSGRGFVHSVRAPLPGPEARFHWAVRHYLRGGRVTTHLGDLYIGIGKPRPFLGDQSNRNGPHPGYSNPGSRLWGNLLIRCCLSLRSHHRNDTRCSYTGRPSSRTKRSDPIVKQSGPSRRSNPITR